MGYDDFPIRESHAKYANSECHTDMCPFNRDQMNATHVENADDKMYFFSLKFSSRLTR